MTSIINKFYKLINLDDIRIGKIIEIFQLSITFTFLGAFAAYFTNKYLLVQPHYTDSLLKTLGLLSIELFILTVIIFYLRKITMIFPSLPTYLVKGFIPYTTLDITMWMVLVFVFVGSIDKLNNKVSLLQQKINK